MLRGDGGDRRWKGPLAYLLGLIPGAVFLFAAGVKGPDPELFAEQIALHGVAPASWSVPLAYLFVAAEAVLGFALVLWFLPRASLAGAMALLVLFMAATAGAWAQGNAEACGCFGRAAARGPASVLIEDGLLLAAALGAFLLAGGFRRPGRRRTVLFSAAALVAVAYAAGARALPVDGLVTGLTPGADLSDLSIEGIGTPLDTGRVLVVVAEAGDDAARALPGLREVSTSPGGPRVVIVIQGSGREAAAWRLKHLPPFPVGHASRKALRQYYRRLPVAFLLRDGVLDGAFWGSIPGSSDLPAAGPAGGKP